MLSGYFAFAGVTFSTMPFNLDQMEEAGFVNMLPGSTRQRIYGRYLFGISVLIIAALIGNIEVLGISRSAEQSKISGWGYYMIVFLAAACILMSVQYLIFFFLGKLKSQQLAGLIYMAPTFGSVAIALFIRKLYTYNAESFYGIVNSINSHKMMYISALIGVSIIFFFLTVEITSRFMSKRDFA